MSNQEKQQFETRVKQYLPFGTLRLISELDFNVLTKLQEIAYKEGYNKGVAEASEKVTPIQKEDEAANG